METVELNFVPKGGWESDLEEASGETPAAQPAAGVKAHLSWVISWEVGVGASVDRGLRLARLQRAGLDKDGGASVETEQYIIGEAG